MGYTEDAASFNNAVPKNDEDGLQLRQGVASNVTNDTATLDIGGNSLEDIRYILKPKEGETVWVLENGPDLLILGALNVDIFTPGMIQMWSGSIANIPDGWALCDGNNGTPDLRGRFIVGAGNAYNVGATGGAEQVTLLTSHMPQHTHTIDAHGHSSGGSDVDHHHTNQFGDRLAFRQNTSISGGAQLSNAANTTGNDAAHENRPPYYALAYIMKL